MEITVRDLFIPAFRLKPRIVEDKIISIKLTILLQSLYFIDLLTKGKRLFQL